MLVGIESDICALVILIGIICLHITRQYISIKRSYLFLVMTVLESVAIGFNILIRCLLYQNGNELSNGLKYLIDIYFAVQYAVPLVFMCFIIAWCGRTVWINHKLKIFFWLPIFVYCVIMIKNFVLQSLYFVDKTAGLVKNTEMNILYAMSIYCMFFGVIYAFVYMRRTSFAKITSVTILVFVVGLAALLQNYLGNIQFLDFMIAVALVGLYLIAQNPSEMLDTNTRVLSRNMMDELLCMDMASGHDFELIILALDDFKFVNKTFGVSVGDMMLIQVSHFLTTLLKHGKVYRYGADQFALQILQKEAEADAVIEVIEERFRHPWITEEVSVMLSSTISCVAYPGDGDSLESIVDVVDYSILCAKNQGKGSIVYARDMDLHALRKEKAIEKAVKQAIDQDLIEVYYQPIYNTEKECFTSAEALVRLHDDILGDISPEIFIPIAEKNGTIVKLGTMIFEKVCQFIAAENLKNTSIEYIEVNVSVVQCMQQDFVENLLDIMDCYNIEPEQINLEVTETAAVNSVAVLQENIEKLHANGISFSLDDYGSGYSTLGYLHQLPFQIIKLDKLMIWDAFENERAGITLKFTVGMLKELKVMIVAEGVETKEQQMHLVNIGCDYLQGWYYSKAIPAIEFAKLIREAS